MALFFIGLIGFIGVHSLNIFASNWRNQMVSKLGKLPWMGVYSLITLGFFVCMVMGYHDAQSSAVIFAEPPTGLKHINSLLIPIALVLAFAGSLPKGVIQKTLKHPQIIGVKLWALGHLLVNWDSTSLLLFGAFLAWAVILRISIKKRGGKPSDTQPNVIWDLLALALGLGISGWLIMGGHADLFRVSAIPGM